jgi:hypothetical protein
MRLALRQRRANQRRSRRQTSQPAGIVENARGMGPHQLATDRAEMLVQASAPRRGNLVARLQHRSRPGRLSAANQAGVPSVLARKKLGDQGAFTVAASREDKPCVMPLH